MEGFGRQLNRSQPEEDMESEGMRKARIQEVKTDRIKEFTDRIERVRGVSGEIPTSEREKIILEKLDEFAQIFDEAGIHYVLDGALNISLYERNFFREHRDIDFSIFSKDIPKLVRTLESKGYALFKFPKNVNEKIAGGVLVHELIRPDEVDVSKIAREHIFFLKVGKNFEIDEENYECFDIHALDQDENGDIVRLNNTVIPKEFYLNNPQYKTISGKQIQLSHPAIFAYHKLLEGREHDFSDLEYALKNGFVSKSDLGKVVDFLKQDEQNGWDEEKPKIKKAQEWLSLRIRGGV